MADISKSGGSVILKGESSKDLSEQVHKYLKLGWELYEFDGDNLEAKMHTPIVGTKPIRLDD